MKIYSFLFFFIVVFCSKGQTSKDYLEYHQSILEAETQISNENYEGALNNLSALLDAYEFVFLKDIKIAAQLAMLVDKPDVTFKFLKRGLASGWTIKEIKRMNLFKTLKSDNRWGLLINDALDLTIEHQNTLDLEIREVVKEMFKNDQKLALGYLFRIGQKAKERYANKKVVPHAIEQMKRLNLIMDDEGYPGEKLIGEPVWMSTILSHHNSISEEFVKSDTLYYAIRPRLLSAIKKGELNPYVFALIDDWRIAIEFDRQKAGYGYIESLSKNQIPASDELRQKLNLRSVGLRNKLVDIQEKTGMDFELAGSGWVNGKIGE